jgi:hypothetical protein
MESAHVENDLVKILFTEEQVKNRIQEMADEIAADYDGRELLLVGILRGAVMADLARALPVHCEMDWMAISSSARAPSPAGSSGSSRTSTPTSPAGTLHVEDSDRPEPDGHQCCPRNVGRHPPSQSSDRRPVQNPHKGDQPQEAERAEHRQRD